MEITWIGVATRGGRRRLPRFRTELWNLHESVITGLPRTNNAAEGWHNAFRLAIGSNHPTIFRFIDELKREQGRTEARIVQLNAGEKATRSQKYKKVNDRILSVVDQYGKIDPIEYLTRISHNFSL